MDGTELLIQNILDSTKTLNASVSEIAGDIKVIKATQEIHSENAERQSRSMVELTEAVRKQNGRVEKSEKRLDLAEAKIEKAEKKPETTTVTTTTTVKKEGFTVQDYLKVIMSKPGLIIGGVLVGSAVSGNPFVIAFFKWLIGLFSGQHAQTE